jgi:hypothetical protein
MKFKAKADAVMMAMDMYSRMHGFYAQHNDFWCNPKEYEALHKLFVAIERTNIISAEERRVKNVYQHYRDLADRDFESEWVADELVAAMQALQQIRFPAPKTVGYWK